MTAIDFNGQIAIVTGSGRGLGKAYALELARRGAKIVVCDIEGRSAQAVADQITAGGGHAMPCLHSVATAEGGAAIVGVALEAYGRVDVIVHNAGFLRPAMFEDMSVTQWNEVIDVHLNGAFHVVQPAWALMKAQNYGRVVLTSSSSIFGYPGSANYVAAKAGLIGLTTALSQEAEGTGIGVNAILPYAISDIVTDNPPVGTTPPRTVKALAGMSSRRTAEAVVPLLVYLASRACTVSGQSFSSLAGRHARVAYRLARGWIGNASGASAEEIADNFVKVANLEDGFEPLSMFEEIDSVSDELSKAKA
jgi:NAD(P)-dependent dehydrogenase (short-subunit alcohol dehydrogenase family)